jgi:spermidine/putrescine transport system substrate-binding protein
MRRLVSSALVASLCLASGPRAASAAPDKVLMLGNWSNYMPGEVLASFEKEQGCRVETPWNYGSNDELLAKLQTKSTGFDVVVPSDLVLTTLIEQGLLERVEAATKVPNLSHVDPAFLGRAADPKNEWSVPYTWGTVGIAWRTDKVKGPVDSWGVFGTDRAAGNAFLLEEARDGIAAALLLRGKSVNTTSKEDLAEAKETLLSWRGNLKGYTGEVKDHLLSGEAWLIQAYNGDVAQAMQERKGVLAFAVPKEGGILWVDNLVIPKGAPHKDLALAFLDFVLRPAVAARISNGIRYAVPNKDALELVDKAVRDDPVVYAPEEVRERLKQEKDLGKDLPLYTDLWSEVRAGG